MSIQSVSAATYPSAAQYTNWKNSLDQLAQAIQSGDLTAAQQAYQNLSQQLPASGVTTGQSQFVQSLSQIGSALQAGNVTQAQQALASLQQQHGHHHHHGGGAGKADTASSANAQTASGAASDATTVASPATSGAGVDISA